MTTHSQRALILYRRWRFIKDLLTYLLTYSLLNRTGMSYDTACGTENVSYTRAGLSTALRVGRAPCVV